MCEHCELKHKETEHGIEVLSGKAYINVLSTPYETDESEEQETWYIENVIEENDNPDNYQPNLVYETSDDGLLGKLPITHCPFCGRKLWHNTLEKHNENAYNKDISDNIIGVPF